MCITIKCICITFWCNISTFEHLIYLNIASQGKYLKIIIWITVPNIYTTTLWNNRSEYFICYYHFLLFVNKKTIFGNNFMLNMSGMSFVTGLKNVSMNDLGATISYVMKSTVIQILSLVLDLAQVIVHSELLFFFTCTELGVVLFIFCFLII